MGRQPLNWAAEHGSQQADAAAQASSELAQLFQQHNDSLVQLLRARLRSDQEARDVAQEAYVKLLQLDSPGTISYLRTYLFRTALNIATDRMRSAAVHAAAHRDPVFDRHIDELTPEKTAAAEEELQRVQAALQGLPSRERYAFLLHRFADMDVEEIAKRLGVTGRSVRNYIVRALLCCREALGETRGREEVQL